MSTVIQVEDDVKQMPVRLMKEIDARSYDEAIRFFIPWVYKNKEAEFREAAQTGITNLPVYPLLALDVLVEPDPVHVVVENDLLGPLA